MILVLELWRLLYAIRSKRKLRFYLFLGAGKKATRVRRFFLIGT